ncbi:hypothetical protein [Microcystis aeruginosa]|nr:hypothetical protein [Microcystis aeruginosa]
MNALPIEKKNQAPYRSPHPRPMHACRHDGDTASAVGTASK